MSKIKFDYEKIRKIIPNLEDIVKDLNSLANNVNNMDIPYYMRSDISSFQNDAQAVDNIINSIIESNRLLDELVDAYGSFAKTLPNYIIEKRDSVIKQ